MIPWLTTGSVGFTGTRIGLSEPQRAELVRQLHMLGTRSLHHGDCQGADVQCHEAGRSLGLHIVGHPPTATGLRAFCECDELRGPKPFLVRNRIIVAESEILIACPDGPERLRSGTWMTVRHARRVGVPRLIISRTGEVSIEGAPA